MRSYWSNWLGNHRAQPHNVESPQSIDEVVQAIDRAKTRHQRIRVLGGGFAWSPLIPTDGTFLSMDRLRGLRDVNRTRHQITMEAGASLREVVTTAAFHGLSVRSPAMFLGLTLGGLIATGSHGTGKNASTLGDSVVAFELVKADGTLLRLESPGSDIWRAVITNLGTLGVLVAVTLQCEPLYNVLEIHERVPLSESATVLPQVLKDFEFVSLFWYPSSKRVLFKLGNRSTLPAVPVKGRFDPTLLERTGKWAGPIFPQIAARAPFLTEILASTLNAGVGTGAQVVSEPYFSHYQQVYPPVISSEFAIPLDHAAEAWTWLSQRLMQYWKAGIRPVNLVVHARFGCGSQGLLAPSAGRASCHLEVLSFRGNPHRELFQVEFDEKMRQSFDGRPHWGKDIVNPGQIASTYGADFGKFLEIRRDLDPDQRFMNPFLRDEVFGLSRRIVRARAHGRLDPGS